MIMYYERFPYKEEVTGSNPVAPTRVFQKSTLLKYKKPHKNRTFCLKIKYLVRKKLSLEERSY